MLAVNETFLGRPNTDPEQNIVHKADNHTIYLTEGSEVLLNTINKRTSSDDETISILESILELQEAREGQFLLGQHKDTISIVYVAKRIEGDIDDIFEYGVFSIQDADLDKVMQALKTLTDEGKITQSLVRLCTPCTKDLIPLTYNELDAFHKAIHIPKHLYASLNTCLGFKDEMPWLVTGNGMTPDIKLTDDEKNDLIHRMSKLFGKSEDATDSSLAELYTFKKLDTQSKADQNFYQVYFDVGSLLDSKDELFEHARKKKINDLIKDHSLMDVLNEIQNIKDKDNLLYVDNDKKVFNLLDEIYITCSEEGREEEFFAALDKLFPSPLTLNTFQGIGLNESQFREKQGNWLVNYISSGHLILRDEQGNLTSDGEKWYTRAFIILCNAYDKTEAFYPQRLVDHVYNVLAGTSHGKNDISGLTYTGIKPEYTGIKPVNTDMLLQIAKATSLHEIETRNRIALMQEEIDKLRAQLAKADNQSSKIETSSKRKSEQVSSEDDEKTAVVNKKPVKKLKSMFDNKPKDSKQPEGIEKTLKKT